MFVLGNKPDRINKINNVEKGNVRQDSRQGRQKMEQIFAVFLGVIKDQPRVKFLIWWVCVCILGLVQQAVYGMHHSMNSLPAQQRSSAYHVPNDGPDHNENGRKRVIKRREVYPSLGDDVFAQKIVLMSPLSVSVPKNAVVHQDNQGRQTGLHRTSACLGDDPLEDLMEVRPHDTFGRPAIDVGLGMDADGVVDQTISRVMGYLDDDAPQPFICPQSLGHPMVPSPVLQPRSSAYGKLGVSTKKPLALVPVQSLGPEASLPSPSGMLLFVPMQKTAALSQPLGYAHDQGLVMPMASQLCVQGCQHDKKDRVDSAHNVVINEDNGRHALPEGISAGIGVEMEAGGGMGLETGGRVLMNQLPDIAVRESGPVYVRHGLLIPSDDDQVDQMCSGAFAPVKASVMPGCSLVPGIGQLPVSGIFQDPTCKRMSVPDTQGQFFCPCVTSAAKNRPEGLGGYENGCCDCIDSGGDRLQPLSLHPQHSWLDLSALCIPSDHEMCQSHDFALESCENFKNDGEQQALKGASQTLGTGSGLPRDMRQCEGVCTHPLTCPLIVQLADHDHPEQRWLEPLIQQLLTSPQWSMRLGRLRGLWHIMQTPALRQQWSMNTCQQVAQWLDLRPLWSSHTPAMRLFQTENQGPFSDERQGLHRRDGMIWCNRTPHSPDQPACHELLMPSQDLESIPSGNLFVQLSSMSANLSSDRDRPYHRWIAPHSRSEPSWQESYAMSAFDSFLQGRPYTESLCEPALFMRRGEISLSVRQGCLTPVSLSQALFEGQSQLFQALSWGADIWARQSLVTSDAELLVAEDHAFSHEIQGVMMGRVHQWHCECHAVAYRVGKASLLKAVTSVQQLDMQHPIFVHSQQMGHGYDAPFIWPWMRTNPLR